VPDSNGKDASFFSNPVCQKLAFELSATETKKKARPTGAKKKPKGQGKSVPPRAELLKAYQTVQAFGGIEQVKASLSYAKRLQDGVRRLLTDAVRDAFKEHGVDSDLATVRSVLLRKFGALLYDEISDSTIYKIRKDMRAK